MDRRAGFLVLAATSIVTSATGTAQCTSEARTWGSAGPASNWQRHTLASIPIIVPSAWQSCAVVSVSFSGGIRDQGWGNCGCGGARYTGHPHIRVVQVRGGVNINQSMQSCPSCSAPRNDYDPISDNLVLQGVQDGDEILLYMFSANQGHSVSTSGGTLSVNACPGPCQTTTMAPTTTTTPTTTTATTTKTTTTVTTTTLSLTAGRARVKFGEMGEVPRAKAIDACDRKGKHLCTLWELLDQEDLVKGKGCFRKMKLWTSSSSSTCAQETENGAFLVSYDGCSKVRTSCEPPEAHAMFMCCDGPAPPERRLRGTATREIPTVLV